MNESVFLQFKTAAGNWALLAASNERGLRFQEPDPYDRLFQLQFGTDNPVTEQKLNDVRRIQGWSVDDPFQFLPSLENGGLRLSGVDANAFPSGDYWFRIRLQDTKTPTGKLPFQVRRDAAAFLPILVAPDARQVHLAIGHDARVDRLLDVPACVEGQSLRAWLNSDARAMRKACALNLVSKLRSFPSAGSPFIDLVNSVFAVKPDRIYASVKPDLKARLDALCAGSDFIVECEGPPVDAAVHRQLVTNLPVASDAARATDYTFISYRADGQPSLQTVLGVPPDGSGCAWYADFDLDLADSLQDVRGFGIHMGELLGGQMTDHLALHDELAGGATKPYLYYTVTNT